MNIDFKDAGGNVASEITAAAETALPDTDEREDFLTDLAVALLPDEILERVADLVSADEGTRRTLFAMGVAEEWAKRNGAEFGS